MTPKLSSNHQNGNPLPCHKQKMRAMCAEK